VRSSNRLFIPGGSRGTRTDLERPRIFDSVKFCPLISRVNGNRAISNKNYRSCSNFSSDEYLPSLHPHPPTRQPAATLSARGGAGRGGGGRRGVGRRRVARKMHLYIISSRGKQRGKTTGTEKIIFPLSFSIIGRAMR